MNAERLLAHYSRIADAPDAIPRLRRFILDLAVRGKLVPQDPSDEPASELLKRIAKEKARLVKAGEIRGGHCHPVGDDELPFVMPAGWSAERLAAISYRIHYGYTASADAAQKGVRLLRITDIQDNTVDWPSVPGCTIEADAVNQYRLDRGDILIARTGGTIGKSFLVREIPVTAVFASYLIRVQGTQYVFEEFLKLFLESPLYWSQLREGTRGTGQPNVNGQTLGNLIVPLPPLAEQRRIVAKVDELMALCDRLEAAQTEREATRDRLATASLARLNAPDPDPTVFADHARFALANLPALTARPDQIKQLRQAILNLAVRGKLVPQDPNDEPASELLKRIAKEIATYSKENRIGQSHPEPFKDEDLPFCAPPGWQWTRLCALFKIITDGDHQPPPKADKGVAFLTIGNITTGRLDFSGCRLVPEAYYQSLAPYRSPTRGDILYTVVGATYGRPAVVETDRDFCVQRHIAILKPVAAMDLRFLVWLLASPLIYEQASRSTTGTAQPTIALRPLRNFVVPAAPLAEQHRIVAKVDELMALCDRLEASLDTAADTRRRLLDALLAEALAPVDVRETEAAE
jgi:type I restriction enzyme S subunit